MKGNNPNTLGREREREREREKGECREKRKWKGNGERERERERGGKHHMLGKEYFLEKDNLNNVFMIKKNQILL